MAAPDELAPGEIARALERLERTLDSLRTEIAGLPFVRQDVWNADHQALLAAINAVRSEAKRDNDATREDLAGTQDNLKWLVRVVAGALISAVVVWLLTQYGSAGQ